MYQQGQSPYYNPLFAASIRQLDQHKVLKKDIKNS